MKPNAEHDVYDGHGKYAAEAERELSWLSVRRFVEFVLGAIAGWTLAYWVYLAMWPTSPRTIDTILGGIGLAIVWFFGYLLFGSAIGDLTLSRRDWLNLAVACVAAFLLGYVLPDRSFDRQIETAERTRRQSGEDMQMRLKQVRRKWYDDVHAAGAHGPAGEEPPMLHIEDHGRRVIVRNLSDRNIRCVQLSRGGWHLSAFRDECARLVAGGALTFELRSGDEQTESRPLEFKIGDPFDPDPSWWSDEALKLHYGKEFEVERSDVR